MTKNEKGETELAQESPTLEQKISTAIGGHEVEEIKNVMMAVLLRIMGFERFIRMVTGEYRNY
ncbi:MAG: hypothetical protein PHD53_00855 [Methylococcales bacterium]|nr:hypothetical protein [Methylococcales bacterium]